VKFASFGNWHFARNHNHKCTTVHFSTENGGSNVPPKPL